MDAQLLSLIPTLGFGSVACIYLWKHINKKDAESRQDTKQQIAELKEENKEDKKLFQDTVMSFNLAISEFKTVNNNMASIECKLNTIEQDITVIKTKMDK